jgi:DNA-directed RNA polymerase specialized sigma24 family protein
VKVLGIRQLGCFEAIVCYLREMLSLSSSQIAQITGRSRSTVAVSYHNARKKWLGGFTSEDVKSYAMSIPVSILKNTKLSVLESIVWFLKERHAMTYHEIAVALNRDDRTIWTVYRRGMEKREDEI